MPKVAIYDLTGKKTGEEIELMDYVFGVEFNEAVVHQAVVMQQANERQGTHATKTRGMVRGGGRKLGNRKVLAVPVPVPFVPLCGSAAVPSLDRAPAAMLSICPVKPVALLSAAH